jgi:predicted amidophosphoribosyltransferase
MVQSGARHEMNSRRENDKRPPKQGTMPQILCWNCHKLTPFELDRCQHCGSAFAGSTGGAYGSGGVPASRAPSGPKPARVRPKRTLAEIVEDLQQMEDGPPSVRGRPRERELSVHLYQCPSCGRFVSEQATDCVCGAGFAPISEVTFACPECASHVPSDVDACPVCGAGFESLGGSGGYAYACPRCGVHVASDALRCSCGVWFED